MGIISLEKVSQLYWLGRYAERVYTTLRMFNQYYDEMIDRDAQAYIRYCERLSIPNIYRDREDFDYRYLFDQENPDSLYANLRRAYDNAILLRNEISSDVLAYIQMSLDLMGEGSMHEHSLLEMQSVVDYLLAFWGAVDDYVEDEESRNLMKSGKYVERLDLYFRFGLPVNLLEKEFSKMKNRLGKLKLYYRSENLARLSEIIAKKEGWKENYGEALDLLGTIISV